MAPLTTFTRDGLQFDVDDAGPPDGEPIVLLHGFPQDRTSYRDVVPQLHGAGFRTLVPDQRGYSPGARPEGRAAYAMTELVGDVVALLEAAGMRSAHVVGHDWGGAVAWAMAANLPERVRTLVALSTPHPLALVRSFVSSRQLLSSWYMGFFQAPVVPEQLIKRTVGATLRRSGLPFDFAQHYTERMHEKGALTAALNWYRAMPMSLAKPLGPVSVPTTYAWGRDDFALGRKAAEMTQRFVTGPYRFEVLDAGHWLPENVPDQVAALILDRCVNAP